MISVTEINGIN